MKKTDLFVPGRLCLFGEHSDWAGEYRQTDRSVLSGKCIVAGTDQGVYATAEPAEEGFFLSQILENGSPGRESSYPSSFASLAEVAAAAVFDSYAAGTAAEVIRKYPGLGLKLEVTSRDLPLKKGLSSSAAMCVLVARAFNRVHQLNLSVEEEMEFAYRGELLTGSHCGRMDQACAYGRKTVLLTFDGNRMTAETVINTSPLYFLIVDLRANKNTRRILKDLNSSFKNENRLIRKALGEENHRITSAARRALENGDTIQIGRLMTEAQKIFDEMVVPSCPSELTAPRLHEILQHEAAVEYALGGKGVGSQGDGTAQFICRGPEERDQLATALESSAGVICYNLTL